MKTAADFKWYVGITPQGDVALVAFCPECGSSMSFSDSGQAGISTRYSIQSHQCYQKIVSEPK